MICISILAKSGNFLLRFSAATMYLGCKVWHEIPKNFKDFKELSWNVQGCHKVRKISQNRVIWMSKILYSCLVVNTNTKFKYYQWLTFTTTCTIHQLLCSYLYSMLDYITYSIQIPNQWVKIILRNIDKGFNSVLLWTDS